MVIRLLQESKFTLTLREFSDFIIGLHTFVGG